MCQQHFHDAQLQGRLSHWPRDIFKAGIKKNNHLNKKQDHGYKSSTSSSASIICIQNQERKSMGLYLLSYAFIKLKLEPLNKLKISQSWMCHKLTAQLTMPKLNFCQVNLLAWIPMEPKTELWFWQISDLDWPSKNKNKLRNDSDKILLQNG